MANELAPELSRRKRTAGGAFKRIEEVVKKTKDAQLRALFHCSSCPVIRLRPEPYESRMNTLSASRSVESRGRCELRRRSKIRDTVAWARSYDI
ncbi:unnamed protein product [Heligmosomoides polygyrus]|uniref:Uncharacterized protein n=1 Tax=Heligmosomoides polygyrus TaxID=6339 RepID=A0A183FMA3_HELPZ|nr:unnamed protein product [Heligmosomoides polygyrus]